MRVLVVYESMFGNTEAVARAIADGLRERLDVELTDVAQAPPEPDDSYDLVVAGGPTHAFSMTRASTRADARSQGAQRGHETFGLREWLAGMSAGGHRVPLATFDTRVAKVRRLPGSAAKAAAKEARRHGYAAASAPASFYVLDTPGPLQAGELERAHAWGRSLAEGIAASGAGPR